MKKSLLFPTLALGLVSIATLTGCSVVDELRNEAATDFATTADLNEDWSKDADWVPAGSTDIRTRYSTVSNTAILRATTASPLDPELCVEIDRQSGPAFEQDWSGDAFVDNAWACDNWTVVATDDGWYGWTPNYPEEQEQSPSTSGVVSPTPAP